VEVTEGREVESGLGQEAFTSAVSWLVRWP
jgi:hypothetical protein